MLSDLYLVINTLGVLFPSTTNAINTVGRYYLKTNPFYNEFYNVLRKHLVIAYSYMQVIVNTFVRDFQQCEIKELECFIQTLPEI
jgi:hypothetical protein